MAWVKLDDGFFNNQKIVSVSKDAKIIYLAALCHAGATLSDGYIPRNAVVILAAQCDVRSTNKVVNELVDAGLWIPVDGGFDIHDYLEHNTSSQDIHAKREAAKERMHRNRSQNVRANKTRSSQNVRPTKETDTETEAERPSTGVLGGGASAPATPEKPKPKTKRATQVPDDFAVTEQLEAWGASQDPPFSPEAMRVEVPQFVDYYRGKGEARKDWVASFRTWMRNSRKFSGNARAAPTKPDGKITSVDQLFAEGVDDESTGYPENSHDFESRVASEWPGQSGDTSVDTRASGTGFRAIAGGRR